MLPTVPGHVEDPIESIEMSDTKPIQPPQRAPSPNPSTPPTLSTPSTPSIIPSTIPSLPQPNTTLSNDPSTNKHQETGGQVDQHQSKAEAEEKETPGEDGHETREQTKAVATLLVSVSAVDARVREVLDGIGTRRIDKAQFESEWTADSLSHLVDAADTEQLLGLLSMLDDKPLTDSLSFHHLSYEAGGVHYLRDVSGSVEPGKLTALIGSPDAGITLLLSLLAGRQPLAGKMTGEILFNGAPISVATRQHVGYVVKEDPNLPQLTVYETLNFSARLRVANESPKLIRYRTLLWMKVLGLSHTYNTVVGDALTRGVSGGERRRVSYGCEVIAGQSIVLADLPTNGLDSTSAFALIKNITTVTRTGRAALVSIVQPSPEIFHLFDTITVMSKGSIIYSGSPSLVESYFNSQGFQRPDGKTLPDWTEEMSGTPERFWISQVPPAMQVKLSSMQAAYRRMLRKNVEKDGEVQGGPADKAEQKEMLAKEAAAADPLPDLVRPQPKGDKGLWQALKHQVSGQVPYVAPDLTMRGQAWVHMNAAWQKSAEYAVIEKHLRDLPRHPADGLAHQMSHRYAMSFPYQLHMCLQRQMLLTYRNKGIWAGNVVRGAIMGIIVGTLFINLGLNQDDLRVRFGLFFFMIMNSGMGTAQMIPVHFEERSTFYNQRQNGYYSSAAYYLASYLTQLPVGAVETFIFSIIVYPLVGLQDGISAKYGYLWLVLLLVNFVSRAWIMFLVAVSPTEAVTQVLQPITMLLFSTMCGFLAPKSSIPSGWSWLYYVSFFTYALRGLSINEQYGLVYNCDNDASSCPYQTGYEVLGLYDMQGDYSERWTDVEKLVWFFISFVGGGIFMYTIWQWSHAELGEPPSFFDENVLKSEESRKMIERAASHARSQHKVDHKAYIEWRDLCYSVPIKNRETGEIEQRLLLDHTYGWAQPNAMIALMGASGAGKSTLMDVLALKKNFAGQQITGTVLVNGVPQEPISFSRIAGYVEQFDSHNEMSTVREAIEVSARLRLPTNTSEAAIQTQVARVLASLGLTHLQHLRIGNVEQGGIAPEARKKVTIAVELIMNPSLLFLDEPTTGLDAPGALSVMKAVRELAKEIAVVCTIHQPSAEIVNMFDGLLLMKSGGQVAYFGPLKELPDYFAQQRLGEYREGQNLGDFALASIKRAQQGTDLDGKPVDVANCFLGSPQGQSVMARLAGGIVPEEEKSAVHTLPESDYPGLKRQVAVLTRRFFVSALRDTNTNGSRWVTCLFFAFMVGTLFVQLGHSQLDSSNRVAAVFMSIMYCVFTAPVKAPARYAARPVYFREYGSRMYSAFPYWLSRFVSDIPTIIGEITCYSLIVYFAAGLTLASGGTHFAIFLATLLVVRVMGLQWNETVTGLLADAAAGTAMFTVTVIICMLFSGFLIQKVIIPNGWIWMYYISFIRYPLDVLSANELRDITYFTCDSSQLYTTTDDVCVIPADQNGLSCPVQCGKELLDQFGISYGDGDIILNFFIVVIYATAFTGFSYFMVRNVNHVKR